MKPGAAALPGAVVVGLVLAVVLDTFIQIAWKLAGNAAPTAAAFGALSSPFFYAAMLGLAAQLFNWMRVLARADLSFAQPFTALSYLSVLALSAHSLNERISAPKVMGVCLILIGVFLISRTPFRSPRPADEPGAVRQ
jgi:drug/metabolite transporter (DMT)-like permease